MLKKIKTYIYIIEFKKRNLSYAHILIIVYLDDIIT